MEDKEVRRVVEDILREGRKKTEETVRRAEEEARVIVEGAKVQAEEEKQTRIREAERRGRTLKESLVAEAKMKARMEFLAGRERIVESILERVLKRLGELGETAEYRRWLLEISVRACSRIEAKRVILRANQRDTRFLKSRLGELEQKSGKSISIGEPIETVGGVRAESEEGTVSIDETLESTIRRNLDGIKRRIVELLISEER